MARTAESAAKRPAQATLGRRAAGAAVWTIGYEGRQMGPFLDALTGAGVRRLVDVRDNPWSRKPGFSKTGLQRFVEGEGIAYTHLKALGCPAEIRKGFDHADAAFEAAYREHLGTQQDALFELEALAHADPAAILCMERDVAACHRRVIAEWLRERGFEVRHL